VNLPVNAAGQCEAGPDEAAMRQAIRSLEALCDDLARRGLAARLVAARWPRLTVSSRSTARLSETIYAAPGRDGQWWLWWSWAERIATIDGVAEAAAKIAHVLAVP